MRFAEDKYALRVMQVCVESSSEFRSQVIQLMKLRFKEVVSSSTATFLLDSLLKITLPARRNYSFSGIPPKEIAFTGSRPSFLSGFWLALQAIVLFQSLELIYSKYR